MGFHGKMEADSVPYVDEKIWESERDGADGWGLVALQSRVRSIDACD